MPDFDDLNLKVSLILAILIMIDKQFKFHPQLS